MVKIVQKENKVLRQKALSVPAGAFGSLKIKKIIQQMKTALAKESDGVAIAAPQIGESVRIFVVSGKVFSAKGGPASGALEPDAVFINPKIIKISRDKKFLPEGCLSVRWLYGKVKRASKATVEAYDENGNKFVRGASGLLAQIFQHEIDHLDGVLFIDKAKEIQEMMPENYAKK